MKKKTLYDYFYGTKANQTPLTKEKISGGNRFINFWKIYARKFFKFITVNLLYTVMTYPIFCAVMVFFASYSESFREFMSQDAAMAAFPWVAIMITGSVELLASGFSWIAYVILGCSILLYGPLTAGYFYYLRNSAREEHVWFSDVYTKGRRNWKQGLFFGILDLLILFSIMNYAISYSVGEGAAVSIYNFTKYLAFFLGILYYLMRFYIYTMLVTFNLKVIQLIKNGMIFLFVNLKWNFWTLVLTSIATVLTFFIHPVPSFILYPAVYLTFIHFAGVYNGYNVIDKYMVQPALAETRKTNPPEDKEPVFHDN